jgi:hypothetical protein
MKMNVFHFLAGVRTIIEYKSVTVMYPQLPGNIFGGDHKISHYLALIVT